LGHSDIATVLRQACEILHYDGKSVRFYNLSPKFRGPSAKKFRGQKHAKFGPISDDFKLTANISGTDEYIQNRTSTLYTEIPPTFGGKKSDEFWSTNNSDLGLDV